MTIIVNTSIACGFFIVGLVFGCTFGFLIGAGIGFVHGLCERSRYASKGKNGKKI